MTPDRLRVETSLHGFTCTLPGALLGSNSGWILAFVTVWWLVGLGALMLLDQASRAGIPVGDTTAFVVGAIAVMGWAVGWPVYDRWRARMNPIPMALDGSELTVGGSTYPLTSLRRVTVRDRAIDVEGEHGWAVHAIGKLTWDERTWLERAVAELTDARLQGGEARPEAHDQLKRALASRPE